MPNGSDEAIVAAHDIAGVSPPTWRSKTCTPLLTTALIRSAKHATLDGPQLLLFFATSIETFVEQDKKNITCGAYRTEFIGLYRITAMNRDITEWAQPIGIAREFLSSCACGLTRVSTANHQIAMNTAHFAAK